MNIARPPQTRFVLFAVAIATACAATYGQLAQCDFIQYDDQVHTFANPHLVPTTWGGLLYLWHHPYEQLYIPFAYTAFAALLLLAHTSHAALVTGTGSAYNPHVFHIANIVMHVANTLFVFYLLRRIVKRDTPALIGSLLFALHPLQVESVAWISEMRGQLCSILGFISAIGYIRAWDILADEGKEIDGRTQWKALGLFIGAFLCFGLALLTKPSAVIYPVLIPLLDSLIHKRTLRHYIREFWPWAALSILSIYVTHKDQYVMHAALTAPYLRPFVAADALMFYVGKLFVPGAMAIDYGRTPHVVLSDLHSFQLWVIPLALIGAMLVLARKRPWIGVATWISLVCLGPNLGLIPFGFQYYSTVTDRYAYLALIGPALIVAKLCTRIQNRWLYVVPVAILVILGSLSFTRCADWKDTITIMKSELAVNPNSSIALVDIGNYYQDRGEHRVALRNYRLCIQQRPDLWRGYYNAATSLMAVGDLRGAVEMYLMTFQYNNGFEDAHLGLANAYIEQRRPALALDELNHASKINKNAAKLHYERARAYTIEKKFALALAEIDRQIQIDDSRAEFFACKGVLEDRAGEYETALASFHTGRAMAKTNAQWLADVGTAEWDAGELDNAFRDLSESATLAPNAPLTRRTLANVTDARARGTHGVPMGDE